MKIIHTADWHLGQRLHHQSREAEHSVALQQLAELIRREKADMLLVAGDVFDVASPPPYAQKLYFSFLSGLMGSNCRHIVIIGGNHDSAAALNAPAELLKALNIHVVGGMPADPKDEIIPLYAPDGSLEAVVAAVPFLHERDLRSGESQQTQEERLAALQTGLTLHYQHAGKLAAEMANDEVPVIGMGHLFVAGGWQLEGKNNTVHLGGIDVLPVSAIAPYFDYLALGHLHRPHCIPKHERVCYAGSLIPLDFNEIKTEHGVWCLAMNGKEVLSHQFQALQPARQLLHLKGTESEVRQWLPPLQGSENWDIWVKAEVSECTSPLTIFSELQELVRGKFIRLMEARPILSPSAQTKEEVLANYTAIDINDVENIFKLKCEREGITDPQTIAELLQTLRELQALPEPSTPSPLG